MTRELLAGAFDDQTLRDSAIAALDAIDATPTAVEPIHRGNRKQTAIVRVADREPVVVQVAPDRAWARTEGTLLRAIAKRTSVPVPPLLASGCHEETGYLVTAYVAGRDLHEQFTTLEPTTRARLARSFGRALAHLHEAFAFDGYGPVEATDDALVAQRSAWDAWFESYAHQAIDRLPPAFDPLRSDLQELVTGSVPAPDPPGRLYAWDFRPGNALVADDELAAVVDWEAPLSVPASLSVANAEYLVADWYVDDTEPLRAAFERGYRSVRPYPSIPATYRAAAIADSAVDSTGTVTNPRYPPLDREGAIAFHRRALNACL